MKFSVVAATFLQLSAGLALPLADRDLSSGITLFHENGRGGGGEGAGSPGRGAGARGAGGAGGEAGGEDGEGAEGGEGGTGGEDAEEGAGGGEGGEGEGAAENEVEIEAQFDQAVPLEGGDIKQDTLYPPGDNGVFETEFQNTVGNTLTVTENPLPAAPPEGFQALEPVSYIVQLADDASGATLQKIDYILNAGNALDISQGKVGKFDAASNSFIIDDTIGELEFEVEENELTLTVADLNGEWGIFVPNAAADNGGGGAGAGAGGEAGEGAGGEAGGDSPTTGNSILDSVLKLIGEGAAAADAAAAAEANGSA